MHDWWVTDRIFPPSPLDPGIPFLNHLTVYSILQCSARNHPEGIPVVAQLLEKVVYRLRRHEGARGGGSGELLAACGGANGPATRAKQGV